MPYMQESLDISVDRLPALSPAALGQTALADQISVQTHPTLWKSEVEIHRHRYIDEGYDVVTTKAADTDGTPLPRAVPFVQIVRHEQ